MNIEHQFDAWHFSKNNKSKLIAEGKKSKSKSNLLYTNGLNPLLATFVGHARQMKAMSNFCKKNR